MTVISVQRKIKEYEYLANISGIGYEQNGQYTPDTLEEIECAVWHNLDAQQQQNVSKHARKLRKLIEIAMTNIQTELTNTNLNNLQS